ncbi:hypothetical protein [Aquamicrobium sp. LC103]|uniref:hypothetical protein n=1 Tax=Aquamicrobium sp. LC103 TaxID=1120658 RepID=UPI00063EAF4E|nr:hypothetical protein [Aquamicrobium sp. LC103]TKT79152.1 hypothetical protein XW59_009475 [Aquamicrobium sp. LC103]
MADDSVKTIYGTFATRAAADRAVEHLVQEHKINRADIFVQAEDAMNTAGTAPSGGDASREGAGGSELGAALRGKIQVSADVGRDEIAVAKQAFRDAGASDVRAR